MPISFDISMSLFLNIVRLHKFQKFKIIIINICDSQIARKHNIQNFVERLS